MNANMTQRAILFFTLFLLGSFAMASVPVIAYLHLGPLVGTISVVSVGMQVTNIMYWLLVPLSWAVTIEISDGPAVL